MVVSFMFINSIKFIQSFKYFNKGEWIQIKKGIIYFFFRFVGLFDFELFITNHNICSFPLRNVFPFLNWYTPVIFNAFDDVF